MKRWIAWVFVAAGCGGGSSGGSGPSTPAELVAQIARALCAWSVRCGSIGASEEAQCVTQYQRLLTTSQAAYSLDEAVAAGRLSIDAAEAARCLGLYPTLSCLGGVNQTCQPIIGRVASGGACRSEGECANGYCDQGKQMRAGCPGVCKPYPPVGGSCADAPCAPGNFCQSTARTCAPLGADGAPCRSLQECRSGLLCAGTGANGTCRAPLAAGSPCSPAIYACADGTFCDPASSTCQPKPGAGSACSAGCQDGLACARAAMPPTGTCVPWLDLGKACDPSLLITGCPADMKCDPASKVCARAPAPTVGSDCSMSGCVGDYFGSELYCDGASKRCAAKVPFGAACTPGTANPCLSGTCDPATKTCALVCA